MRKLLKYVHRTSVNRYKDKEIIEVFALHPVNIMHMPRPSSERIVFGKNVIIDGLHILYRLLHREVPEIEVTIYPEICVHDINSLYGIIYGKNKDIYRYYLIHSHSTVIYYLHDEEDDKLYAVYIPRVSSNKEFQNFLEIAKTYYPSKNCFFQNIYTDVWSSVIYSEGGQRKTVVYFINGFIGYNGEITLSGRIRSILKSGDNIEKEEEITVKNISLDELKQRLWWLKRKRNKELKFTCFIDTTGLEIVDQKTIA